VEQPGKLGAGKVRVEDEPGLLPEERLEAALLQRLARRRGAPVLPDDGVAERLAGAAVPEQGGLALVGDADRGDVAGGDARLRDRLARRGELRLPDLARVVLDP